MRMIKAYIDKSKAEAIENDIQSTINGIVAKCSKLPYKRQLEAVGRIKSALAERKTELEEELSEVNEILTKI